MNLLSHYIPMIGQTVRKFLKILNKASLILLVFIILLLFSNTVFGQSFSFLKIELNTSGAIVYLDKVQIKNEILANVLTVASGKHDLKAVKEGFLPFETSFSLSRNENKTITITLDKDPRSVIVINSTSTNTKLKIDSQEEEWNAVYPFRKVLQPGNHTFTLSEYGKIEVTKDIYIYSSTDYSFIVNLSSSLPIVTPQEIGRSYRQLNASDYSPRSETKIETNNLAQSTAAGILAIIGMVVGGKSSKSDDSSTGMILGALGGGLLGLILVPVKEKTVPDNENIQYNIDQAREKAAKEDEISKYNSETRNLILKKQQEKYNESAIKIINK